MKTALFFLVLVLIVGLGYYRGWFHLSAHNGSGQPNVSLSMDKDKMEADKDQVVGKVQDLRHKAAVQAAATTQKAQD